MPPATHLWHETVMLKIQMRFSMIQLCGVHREPRTGQTPQSSCGWLSSLYLPQGQVVTTVLSRGPMSSLCMSLEQPGEMPIKCAHVTDDVCREKQEAAITMPLASFL